MLHGQNGALRRELQRLRLQLQESRAEGGLPAAGNVQNGSEPSFSARTKVLLDPSLHGSVGRLAVPELGSSGAGQPWEGRRRRCVVGRREMEERGLF